MEITIDRTTTLFHKLVQGTQTFQLFYAEFRRLAAVSKYDETALIHELLEKVNYQIQNELLDQNFTTLNETAACCALIDQNIPDMNARMNRTRPKTTTVFPSNSKTARSFRTKSTPTRTLNDDDRGRSSTPRMAPAPTNPDRYRHMTEGKCLACHKIGHRANDCPLRRQNVSTVPAETEKEQTTDKKKKKARKTRSASSEDAAGSEN